MRFLVIALVLCLAGGISARRGNRPNNNSNTGTSTESATTDSATSGPDTTDADTSSDSAVSSIIDILHPDDPLKTVKFTVCDNR